MTERVRDAVAEALLLDAQDVEGWHRETARHVADVALDAIPDGWAKVRGEWVELVGLWQYPGDGVWIEKREIE